MSPDAKTRLTIYALENGFFSFAESYETTEDLREFGMGVETYWSPGWESGLYESADKAEKNAYAMIPWLQANSS